MTNDNTAYLDMAGTIWHDPTESDNKYMLSYMECDTDIGMVQLWTLINLYTGHGLADAAGNFKTATEGMIRYNGTCVVGEAS